MSKNRFEVFSPQRVAFTRLSANPRQGVRLSLEQAQRRRRAAAVQRSRRLFLAATVVAVLVGAVAVTTVVVTRQTSSSPSRNARATAPARIVLNPPAPIPGYLLIADRGNNRMLLVDSSRRIFWRYPGGGSRAMPFRFDDDTFFSPNHDRIISNQEDQNTIQIISFPGRRVMWRYGHVDVKSGRPGYLNTPDDAYLLPDHRVTVADAYNCRVIWISPGHRIVRQYGTTGVCRHDPPRYLGAVNGATPLADGGTLVSEITGSWVDDIGPNGRVRWDVQAPVSYPSDPQLLAPNRILLADYAHPGAAIIMNKAGRVLWKYAPASGSGELNHPSLAMRIAPGLVAINDDFRNRVVIVSIRRHKIVWQYGHTDQPGTAPGYLNTPDGLDLLSTNDAQASRKLVRLLEVRTRRTVRRASAPMSRTGAQLTISTPYRLPAPVEREVAVPYRGGVILAGGLDSSGSSTSGVFRMSPSTGVTASLGSLPQVFHDAAGAILGNGLFVFGGGAAQSSATVQRFDLLSRRGRIVGSLPRALSDISAASVRGAVYLVGGYDGSRPRPEIYRTTDGLHFELVGRLPVGLRYPAVADAGGGLVIAGGTAAGGASNEVYFFDPRTRSVSVIGRLPSPVAHAAAITLGGVAYLVGGVDATGRVIGSITKIDPRSRQIAHVAGSLPVRDAATVQLPAFALVIGGASMAGTTGAVHRLARG